MKAAVTIIVVLVILASGGIILAQHHNANTPAAASSATNSVTISDFAFSPANITVRVDTNVTWTNKDSVAHTVTETDGLFALNSGDLNQSESYTFAFKTPGTYKYHCSIHPDMTGTVTVTN